MLNKELVTTTKNPAQKAGFFFAKKGADPKASVAAREIVTASDQTLSEPRNPRAA